MKLAPHARDNNILQNYPILQEDIIIDEDIYGTSVSHPHGKSACHKVNRLKTAIVTKVPKGILYRYNNFTLCCYLMQINGIGLINTISQHILFDTVRMI